MEKAEFTALLDEVKLTPKEIAAKYGLHATKVRRMFLNEPGVIRIGHSATQHRGQYYTLRIPVSIVERVFRRLMVGAVKAHKAP